MEMTEAGAPERRRFLRVDAKVIAWYRPEGTRAAGAFGALTKNISAGGFLFESDEAIPLGSNLEIEMKLPGTAEVLRSTARAVRLEAVGGGRYDVGVSFESMPEEQRIRLETFVQGAA